MESLSGGSVLPPHSAACVDRALVSMNTAAPFLWARIKKCRPAFLSACEAAAATVSPAAPGMKLNPT